MEQDNKKLISWDGVLDATMKIPGIKVNREDFLEKAFCLSGEVKDFSNSRPLDYYDEDIIEKVAKDVINGQTIKVTAVSTIAGIPGGPAIFATMPADITQFYCHAIILAQKLGYIYGWPDLLDEEGRLSEGARNVLTIFIGVMMGSQAASKVVGEIAKRFASEAAKRIPQMALTKTAWYPVIKQIGKWLGIQLTKQSVGKTAGKVIPILGGFISGGITFATFRPMAGRLRNELRNEMHLFNKVEDHFYFENDDDIKTNLSDEEYEVLRIRACINIAKIDFNLSEDEQKILIQMISDADISEEYKATLLSELHKKEIVDINFSAFCFSEIQSLSLLESLVSVVNLDDLADAEKIYLFKIAKDLGISKETVAEMVLADRGL
jgi:hypothetical protein